MVGVGTAGTVPVDDRNVGVRKVTVGVTVTSVFEEISPQP